MKWSFAKHTLTVKVEDSIKDPDSALHQRLQLSLIGGVHHYSAAALDYLNQNPRI